MESYFSPALFKFLKELKSHNNREWFQDNKQRFEDDVKGPMLCFIKDFAVRLRKISPHFIADARPVGGSLFRIYRDVRFAKDKSPYKTHLGAHFPQVECGKDASAPGFYLHLEPGNSMGGGGIWHPESESLKKIRDEIVGKTKEWKKIRDQKLEIHGETLQRPPRGYDANHAFVDDLKRKDFFAVDNYTDKQVCAPDFMDRFVDSCKKTAPMVKFMTGALRLRWK